MLGADADDESDWRELDAKVNTYPYVREFKCIGSGGEEFVTAMLSAARSVAPSTEVLRREEVIVRPSRNGTYVSVTVYVTVASFEQVKATYELMRADERLRYFL